MHTRLENPGDFNRVLLKWLDSGFFYKTPDNAYQVLVPSRLASFASYLSRSSDATSASGAQVGLGTISRIGSIFLRFFPFSFNFSLSQHRGTRRGDKGGQR